MTKSGTTVVFYLDGVAYSAPEFLSAFSFSSQATIGAWGDGLEGTFLGSVDDLAVYDRPLSSIEIQAIYGAASSGKCSSEPPAIIIAPSDQTVIENDSATFWVVVRGATPRSYQWALDGVAISGATDAALTLTNVQQSQAGTYSVNVTNAFGSTNSAGALLAVREPPPCVAPVSGIVGWWRAEGNGVDEVGTNNGVLAGSASFGGGRVGQSFVFQGSGDGVNLGAATNLWLQSFSIEAWVRRASATVVNASLR